MLAACEKAPVAWGEPSAGAAADSARGRLAVDAGGRVSWVADSLPPLVLPPGSCQGSQRFAKLKGAEWFAAWWMNDTLVVSRTITGGQTWTAPLVADARDRSRAGCARPAPAIAADSTTGYVHVAYFARPAEGAGLWATHSMDHGNMWHAPVAIVFGDTAVQAAVAADHDTVVVAYETPNATPRRIALALSGTDGHVFERRVDVSEAGTAAAAPRVALRGPTVAVAWTETAAAGGATTGAAARPRLVTRTGRIRDVGDAPRVAEKR